MSEPEVHSHVGQVWASGDAYEPYVGRWSRLVAREFLRWLAIPAEARWLDVGCGTGALSQTIAQVVATREVIGVDSSEGYAAYARAHVTGNQTHFEVGDAQALRYDHESFDAAVSGLVLNFVPQQEVMVSEMRRVVHTGGTVALYVWDYAGEMQLMRHFWDAAAALNPVARDLDEGVRFPICQPEPLTALFRSVGLRQVETRAIDVPTHFRDFDDYWSPFLGGQAPAPSYAMSLNETARAALRAQIRAHLPIKPDGSIRLIARAWAVRGVH
jgi:SAM-dependent methyltransferase